MPNQKITIKYHRGHGKDAKKYYLDNIDYYKKIVRSLKTWRAWALFELAVIALLLIRAARGL